jgi:hypothetical protein
MLISKRSLAVTLGVALVVCSSVAAMAIETTLAGIRLGAPGSDVLKRYGNPTKIVVSYVNVQGSEQAGANGANANTNNNNGGNAGGLLGQLGSYYSSAASDTGGGAPALPGMDGLGMPGAAPGAPAPGQDGSTPPPGTEQQITWTYDLAGGTTLEFLVSDKGVVVQITAGGSGNYALAKTSKGVKFGTLYKDVVMKYGFPEQHAKINKFTRASYADKHRVVFTFLKQKVVGITVALKLDD